jgi:hypothetical protein
MESSGNGLLTLSDLNDDVLRDICDHLVVFTKVLNGGIVRDRTQTGVKNLSLVNRRFRALLRPILLKSIALIKPPPIHDTTKKKKVHTTLTCLSMPIR